jgi:hypothetical protein
MAEVAGARCRRVSGSRLGQGEACCSRVAEEPEAGMAVAAGGCRGGRHCEEEGAWHTSKETERGGAVSIQGTHPCG